MRRLPFHIRNVPLPDMNLWKKLKIDLRHKDLWPLFFFNAASAMVGVGFCGFFFWQSYVKDPIKIENPQNEEVQNNLFMTLVMY
ncbi:hypothetical protein MAR_003433 [Mya arenaria]|uniref:Uncharacterized protein n=1 Tax=Mya arenaria TaxID=6604 RepID=A0ABY7G6T9_MYAAR|nr:hypothetical protein MAR_003433 [Mya arenaria]